MSDRELLGNTPWAQISLPNIQHNLQQAKQHKPDSKVMAVIKANAYGHGAIEVARALDAADAYAVARVDEALELREADIKKPIIILEGFIDQAELKLCERLALTPVVHSAYQLALLEQQAVWLKINSGMSRLGFNEAEIIQHIDLIKSKNVIGLASHFANSDVSEHPLNAEQITVFNRCRDLINPDLPASMANSSAILNLTNTGYDWIRPGILLYGSSGTDKPDPRLKAGMTLTAPVVAINQLRAGEAIGYGSLWQAERDCRVAVVGLGYADGYPREMPTGTPVIVNGERRSLVGRISMDMSFVLLEDDDQVQAGDRVEFWGEQLPVDEVAACGATIAYTLISGLTRRVKRIYS